MLDFLYFGKAKEERKQLQAIGHFLTKRVRYGRDVLPAKILVRLIEARNLCREALHFRTKSDQRRLLLEVLEKQYGDLLRTERHHGRRENAEVALVAIALALGVRAYFLQPFKIPTHSMRPTLLGILNQSEQNRPPGVFLRLLDFVIEGKTYHRAIAPRDSQILSVREARLVGVIPWATTEIVSEGWKEILWTSLQEARDGGL